MKANSNILVVQVAALSEALIRQRPPADVPLEFHFADPVFPAVTCTAQATLRTAALPSTHGMIANGLYFRELRSVLFWEQAASLVSGPRIWDAWRASGRRVGMLFWQQSLGESVDMVLSPKPIHLHDGGMALGCLSRPASLYGELCADLGRPFNLFRYWGPEAGRESTDWIVEATCAVLQRPDAPELLFTYLPHLDYDQQKVGPHHESVDAALDTVYGHLRTLVRAAGAAGYEVVVAGDYAIGPAQGGAVFPNRALREANLFAEYRVDGRAYPDLFHTPALVMADHEVAHVYLQDQTVRDRVRAVLSALPGVEAVLEGRSRAEAGLDHPRSGEMVLVADPGRWFAYPWWSEPAAAPDFAAHVDIHNKPGFDPCELFWADGRPPLISRDTSLVGGTHGRTGPDRRVAAAATGDGLRPGQTVLDLARQLAQQLDRIAATT